MEVSAREESGGRRPARKRRVNGGGRELRVLAEAERDAAPIGRGQGACIGRRQAGRRGQRASGADIIQNVRLRGRVAVAEREQDVALRGHDDELTSAVFSPDGTRVVTAAKDGTARIWPLIGTLEQLATYARSIRLPRALTDDQKKQYFAIDNL